MPNGVAGRPGWGLAEATRALLETADAAEAARRDRRIERALAAFLARPVGSVELDDALADQRIILADHFDVPEAYFTDAAVGEPIAARRRHPAERTPDAGGPPALAATSGSGPEPAAGSGPARTAGSGPAPTAGSAPEPGAGSTPVLRPRRTVGVAAVAAGVLAGVAAGGAVGYLVGVGSVRPPAPVAAAAPEAAAEPVDRPGSAGAPRPEAGSVAAGVVQVRVQAGPAAVTGSGVVLRGGLVLTDDHLLGPAGRPGRISVIARDGRARAAHLIGRDPATGVAVIEADDPNGLVPALLGDSDGVRVGQRVTAVGGPHDPGHGSVAAVVKAVGRPAGREVPGSGFTGIETDAAVRPTDVGGALADARGAVVGIETVGPARSGHAIPINRAVRAADRMIAAARPVNPGPRPAVATRGAAPGAAPTGGAAPHPTGRIVP